jgi:hypothetical protein
MQRVLENEFSWSKSRHEKFQECLRAYFLYYYGAWGGWEENAAADVRELYLLKKLSNRFTWAGSAVHDTVRDVLLELQAGREVDPARVIERTRLRMRADWAHSKKGAYRVHKLRKNFVGLVEHEYQEPIPNEEWKRVWGGAEQALGWFLRSRWMELARNLKPYEWLEVDEGALHSHFEHQGVRFFAIPDFAYREPNGDVVVVDWKTGKAREGYDEQVTGYAIYLSSRYRVPLERIRAVLVYLNEGVEVEERVTEERAQAFEATFHKSVEAMRGMLASVKENRPLPKDAFAMTDDLSACQRCTFRRACGRAFQHASGVAA